MRHFTVTLVLLLVSASLAVAQERPVPQPPDSTRGQTAVQFRQEHGSDWEILWHARTKTPASLMGGSARGYGGPPEQAAQAFLQAHKTLFGIENARQELEVDRTNQSDDGSSRVQYRQMYRGLPVLNSGYLVAFDDEGAIHYVSGDFYPDLQVDPSPRLQAGDVVEAMRSDLGGASSFSVRQEPVLSVFVDNSGEELTAHLAYEARAERRDPLKAYKYVVDAHSGEILQKISLIETIERPERPSEAHSPEPSVHRSKTTPATGTGDVYLTNPLHGSPASVTLRRLDNVSPQVLEGDNIAVTNAEALDATSSTGDFTYSPSNTHFDEVMVYYHSDEFEDWLITDLGMATDQLSCQVSAQTHSSNAYAGADPPNCLIAYGDENNSLGLGNPTRERSIIDHEYMHVVSETYNSLDQDFEAGALDEGYSDFFAVADRHANTSVTSKRLGAYVGLQSGRTVDNSYQLSAFEDSTDLTGDGGFSEHDGGVVLAGALWDFTQSINDVTLAAKITLESLKLLDNDPSLRETRGALLTAADNTGNSQFECDIKGSFADHGMGWGCEPPPAPTNFYLTNTGQPGEYVHMEWDAAPGADSYDIYRDRTDVSGGFQKIGTVTTTTSWTDYDTKVGGYGSTEGASYYVKALNDYGTSPASGSDGGPIEGKSNTYAAREKKGHAVPDSFSLGSSTPNPARDRATIRYGLPEASAVTLTVYDVMGRKIVTLAQGTKPAAVHEAVLDAAPLPSGMYVYRFRAGSFTETERLVVVR